MGAQRVSRHGDVDREILPDPAERYLDELARALPGPRRLKSPILDEVSDGLVQSVAAHRSMGEDPIAAARSAVAEFGSVEDLAGALSREMAGVFAHRLGLALIGSGPVVGLGWLSAFALSSDEGILAQLRPVLAWLPGYGVLLGCVVLAAVLATAAGAGPASRVLPFGPRRAAAAATFAAVGCVAVDALLLTHLVALTADGQLSVAFAALPAALSAVRLILVASAAHRCSTIRTAATALA